MTEIILLFHQKYFIIKRKKVPEYLSQLKNDIDYKDIHFQTFI